MRIINIHMEMEPAQRSTSVGPKEDWMNLPVMVGPNTVVTIQLTPEEVSKINTYGDAYFDKDTIDRRPSQFPVSWGTKRANPNTIGIKGEYAGLKHFLGDAVDLERFLLERPWKMADMGDAIIIQRKPRVFDYKTRTRNISVEDLVNGDNYCAEMDAKFADRKRYSYLQAFIFSAYNNIDEQIHIMGWLTAEDFFDKAQRVPRGHPVPMGRSYGNDCLFVPYRRLRPIAELKGLEYFPLNEEITVAMKQDWFERGLDPVHYVKKYSLQLQNM